MTLSEALKEGVKRGIIDWSLRVTESDGLVKFYIHPTSKSGVTLDFELDRTVNDLEFLEPSVWNNKAVWPE